MQKKYLSLGLIVLILVVLATGFWKWQENRRMEEEKKQAVKQEEEKKEVTEIDMSDWKTYVDNAWGFSIQYPKELYIKTHTQGEKYPGEKCLMCGNGGQLLIISDQKDMGIQDVNPNEKISISIITFKIDSVFKKNQTWKEYLSSNNEKIKKIKINNRDVYRVDNIYPEVSKITNYYFLKNEWVYAFNVGIYGEEKKQKYNSKIADNIFSTFQFTNQ